MDNRVRFNENEVEWVADESPKGVYVSHYREVSRAFSDLKPKAVGTRAPSSGERPFEVDLVRIAPGKKLCPEHAHSGQWEYYIVLSGEGTLLQGEGESAPMRPGDHLSQPPGWIHTIENTGTKDLLYYVIASNPVAEWCFYPDSNKWGLEGGPVFRMVEADYFDGEE